MDDQDLERVKRAAQRENTTVSEWVRRAVHRALRGQTGPSAEDKLLALKEALTCNHPTADIDRMLQEIEQGRALR